MRDSDKKTKSSTNAITNMKTILTRPYRNARVSEKNSPTLSETYGHAHTTHQSPLTSARFLLGTSSTCCIKTIEPFVTKSYFTSSPCQLRRVVTSTQMVLNPRFRLGRCFLSISPMTEKESSH